MDIRYKDALDKIDQTDIGIPQITTHATGIQRKLEQGAEKKRNKSQGLPA